MIRILQQPRKIPGGLRLASNKAQSLRTPLRQAPVPGYLTVPLSQHIGVPTEALVKTGDKVLKGQLIGRATDYISAPVHAPTSGAVQAIGSYPVPHPSGLNATCIVIQSDGEDRCADTGLQLNRVLEADPADIRQRIRAAGIVGLGGAGFPTAVKLNPGPECEIKLLVINAAECEPYISCDEALLCSYTETVIDGIRIMRQALNVQQVAIGIEDSMPNAIECLRKTLDRCGEKAINVIPVASLYPAGGEKQLIYALTGEEVPSQGLPADLGIVCHNVGTAAAVARALIKGEPLISRVVTVTGTGIAEPCNLEVRIGTPMADVVQACGGYTADVGSLLMGGPMMGVALSTDNLPVIKTTNCLLAMTQPEAPPTPASTCIRCGMCTEVCPAQLLPQQLYWYAHAREFDKIQDYNLFDCIECGCCTQVCPSHIPLVQYYRFAKTEIWAQESERQKSDLARQRHEFRIDRLEREKKALEARRAKAKNALNKAKTGNADAKKAAIAAALKRVKNKKTQRDNATRNTSNLSSEQQAKIAEVDKRRAEQQTSTDH